MCRGCSTGGNPVAASNVEVELDSAGSLNPSKDKSTERIDGIEALVIALNRAIKGGSGGRVYEDRGLLPL